MKLVAGSRGSRLALKQVDIVASKLRGVNPPVNVETLIVKTAGDVFRDRPIASIDQKGVFSRAIDEAVLRGEVDFAVHSMKDLPNELPHGTSICAIPERASPFEVLVSVNYGSLDELPPGAVVGTSSPRRTAQILHVRGEIEVKLIRGNVDTRLKKLEEGQYDALILAEAGLARLGREDVIKERLSLREFTPPAGQGALAIVAREEDDEVKKVLNQITHPPSWAAIEAERAFIDVMGGGCKVPLGVNVQLSEEMTLYASLLSPDGRVRHQFSTSGDGTDPRKFGRKAAIEMMEQGASRLIERWS